MKLYTVICMLFFSLIIYTSEDKKLHTTITMPGSIWTITDRKTAYGITTERYHLSAGPKQLPLEVQTIQWLASYNLLCCFEESCKSYIDSYKEHHEDFYESDTKTYRKYYPYKKLDK